MKYRNLERAVNSAKDEVSNIITELIGIIKDKESEISDLENEVDKLQSQLSSAEDTIDELQSELKNK